MENASSNASSKKQNAQSTKSAPPPTGLKVAVLGPKGTYTHQVAKEEFPDSKMLYCQTVYDVFDVVERGKAGCGVVAIENSLEGPVGETLDALTASALGKNSIHIHKEIVLPINHCLAVRKERIEKSRNVKRIMSIVAHPQALGQCRNFIRKQHPKAEIIPVASNSKGAELVKEGAYDACICSPFCADLYGLHILSRDIQDVDTNTTRFVVISKKEAEKSGYDKTSILFYCYENRPGILYEVLSLFAEKRINLTKIESRPSKKVLGDYIFYVDFEGHKSEKRIKECLAYVRKKTAYLKILGSYPRRI